MNPTKIVVIGAGSASFGLGTLATIIRSERLRGSTLSLVDINAQGLETMTQLARRLNQEWCAGFTIESATDPATVLDGAAFVILSIEVPPREKLWRLDWEIPLRHGVRQPYSENGGPGGFAHTARNIPPIMRIVRQMEDHCPNAWLLVFTNPLPRICRAITRYSKIKTVGLCHQLLRAYVMAGWILADELGVHIPPELSLRPAPSAIAARRYVSQQAMQVIDIKAAGLNHFSWVLSIHHRETGEDFYPRFKQRLRCFDPGIQPLSRALMDIFGLFPVPGDDHLSEYLPWLHDAQTKPWEKYKIELYAWDEAEADREAMWQRAADMASGQAAVDQLKQVQSEGAAEIIEGVAANLNLYVQSANLPNDGYISNLPAGAIVEVPAVANGYGLLGLGMRSLPPAIAELCRREIALVDLVVDAAVTGSRELALQALLLDPTINDVDTARNILDDYLEVHAPYLPQFQSSVEG